MSNVVSLTDHKESDDWHQRGPARCLHCRHEWSAAAECGAIDLECPECGLYKGVYIGNATPAPGMPCWQCRCGCELWYFERHDSGNCYLQCVSCGGFSQPWNEAE